jgi:hypothetical protein
MTQTAKLFGFGSYFAKGQAAANDIDLLLVHQAVDRASIEFAILCKKVIRATIPMAHVVMLSNCEESELDFIYRSNAVYLTDIKREHACEQIATLSESLVYPYHQ